MKKFNPDSKLNFQKKPNKKYLLIALITILTISIISYSFALFKIDNQEIVIINGKVGNFNVSDKDLTIAVLVDGEVQSDFPAKGSGYYFDSVTCSNGGTGYFDSSTWKLHVEVGSTDTCTILFTSSLYFNNYIESLLTSNLTTMNNDDPDSNVRYMGKSPNNYVSFNNEIWRIIGVFKVKNAETNETEKRVKIIRESIGSYSWDSAASGTNNGYGINEWSQADIMTTLNSGAYWNRTSGTCYNSNDNTTISCDFSTTGLTDEAKTMMSDTAIWNLGTTTNDWGTTASRTETASQMYTFERSSNNGKVCSSGTYCNDSVARTTEWEGKVGLMYPSDYAYATSGGSTTNRATCLSYALNSWDGYSDCFNNSWLYNSLLNQWAMTPVPSLSTANSVFNVRISGDVNSNYAYNKYAVRPVVYLNANVKIVGGTGAIGDEFQLAI